MPKQSYRLWTPIANALDAYRRRVVFDPSAVYEHTWRLIHIHESMIVTLAALLAARLLDLWSSHRPDDVDRLRRRITGLAAPALQGQDAGDLARGEGCLDGFTQPWVSLLKEFGLRDDLPACAFCGAVRTYLCDIPAEPLAFLDSWKNIADVSRVYSDPISRVDRFAAINSLRNKLAHVPVPYPILEPLHRGLRAEVLSLLSPVRPRDGNDIDLQQWHPPFSGRLLARGVALFGGKDFAEDPQAPGKTEDSVLAEAQEASDAPWSVAFFVRVDQEFKVSLLLLLNGCVTTLRRRTLMASIIALRRSSGRFTPCGFPQPRWRGSFRGKPPPPQRNQFQARTRRRGPSHRSPWRAPLSPPTSCAARLMQPSG